MAEDFADRVLLILGGVILVLVLLLMLGISAVMPRASDTLLGGKWIERHYDSIAGTAESFELWRKEGRRTTRVAAVVHTVHYYGDDCIAFSATVGGTRRYLFACGSGRPFEISPGSKAGWAFERNAVQQQSLGHARVGIAELKQRARALSQRRGR